MSRADKKRRHKAKRQAKRQEARRRSSVSPIKQLADANAPIECWISQNFQQMGQMDIFIHKRAGALSCVVGFLIDEGVVGLKDTSLRMGAERVDLEEMVEMSKSKGISMRRSSPEECRRWIAGAIRWTRENGMRLPKDWVRCVSLLGNVSWESADVSAFKKEFAGHPEDLRQRLIGEPFESYIRRTDIDFIFNDDVAYLDQKTGKYTVWEDSSEFDEDESDQEMDDDMDEVLDSFLDQVPKEALEELDKKFTAIATPLAGRTTAWLAARGETPSTRLLEVWKALLLALALSKTGDAPLSEEQAFEYAFEKVNAAKRGMDEADGAQYSLAIRQTHEHAAAESDLLFKDMPEFIAAGGKDESPDGTSAAP